MRRPKQSGELAAEQALGAIEQAAVATAAGDRIGAIAWLRRARRYAPTDPTPALSLAAALFAGGEWVEAGALFLEVAAACDLQEAWLGAAIALSRLGQAAPAARALHGALSRHVWPGEVAGLPLDRIAAAAGAPGWCALGPDGLLLVASNRGDVACACDGVPVAAGALVPPGAGAVSVAAAGRALLGSPLDVAAMRRTEGIAVARAGGIEGWAWHPGDAARDPVLTLTDGIATRRVIPTDISMLSPRPLMRARRLALGVAELRMFQGPISVTALDGSALSGSPVDPGLEARSAMFVAREVARIWPARQAGRNQAGRNQAGRKPSAPRHPPILAVPAAFRGDRAMAASCPGRPVAVVVPVYRGERETLECLDGVRRTMPAGTRLIVVDDASPEPGLARALDGLAARGLIRLLRHDRNRGFPAAANTGLRAALAGPEPRDVILLNSDTAVAAGWVEGLRAAVHAQADIATATPFSNDASILSYPDSAGAPAPGRRAHAALARLAARTLAGVAVEVPTAVGFCMYLRHEALSQAGVLRDDLFAQGYGEENDLCLRLRHLGWRHVAVPGVHVAHLGARSFGAARAALQARNIDLLNWLYPGYGALIAEWVAADPLAPARRALDAARWRASWRTSRGPATILVTHDSGGGVERCVRERCAAIRAEGGHPLVLRPVRDLSGDAIALDRAYLPGLCRLALGATAEEDAAFPNLVYALPQEADALAALLRMARPARLEAHHLLGHAPTVLDLATALAIPVEVRVHDYAWFCARISLLGAGERYCGEPDVAACESCVADLGNRLEPPVAPRALRAHSAAILCHAARIVAPSRDTATRMERHFPGIAVAVAGHETDRYAALTSPRHMNGTDLRRVCVVGAIGPEKGFDVLLACARDAAARNLPLSFHLVGRSVDDERLLATGRVEITGPYAEADAVALISAQNATMAFILSIVPETWCFALGQAWRANLPVAAFDIGAVAERVRETGRGWLLPLGLPVARINNVFLLPPALGAFSNVVQTNDRLLIAPAAVTHLK